MSTETVVKHIIAQHLAVAPERVTDTADIMENLDADSLDVVELILAFEEEFKIDILDAEIENIKTVSDAVKKVEEYLQKKETK